MVVDFSCIKEFCGSWLDENWDHGFLVYSSDDELLQAFAFLIVDRQKIAIVHFNPTAENIATFLLENFNNLLYPFLPKGAFVKQVTVHETPNCYATAIGTRRRTDETQNS